VSGHFDPDDLRPEVRAQKEKLRESHADGYTSKTSPSIVSSSSFPHRWKETFGSGFSVERVVTPGDAT